MKSVLNIRGPSISTQCPWTMRLEMDFLNGLGRGVYTVPGYRYQKTRLELLYTYRKCLDNRGSFGTVDKGVLREYVGDLIRREGGA